MIIPSFLTPTYITINPIINHTINPATCPFSYSRTTSCTTSNKLPYQIEGTEKPKPKRGRPKGSKNKPKLSKGYNRMVAPNGLPTTGNEDLLQELLPLLAKEELKELAGESEHDIRVRTHLRNLMTQISSRHRLSAVNLKNLKPFKIASESKVLCDACHGTGMVKCEYCEGEGFVDFGEGCKKFYEDFEEGEMVLPDRVDIIGNVHHCPLCGGWTKERCVKCTGFGHLNENLSIVNGEMDKKLTLDLDLDSLITFDVHVDDDDDDSDSDEVGVNGLGEENEGDETVDSPIVERDEGKPRRKGAAREGKGLPDDGGMWLALDMDKVMKKFGEQDVEYENNGSGKGRIQVGKDGLVILRAKQRKKGAGRKPKIENVEKKKAKETKAKTSIDESSVSVVKRKRGRPRKSSVPADDDWPMATMGTDIMAANGDELKKVKAERKGMETVDESNNEPSTDFVNTTDYQVSRELRKRNKNSGRK